VLTSVRGQCPEAVPPEVRDHEQFAGRVAAGEGASDMLAEFGQRRLLTCERYDDRPAEGSPLRVRSRYGDGVGHARCTAEERGDGAERNVDAARDRHVVGTAVDARWNAELVALCKGSRHILVLLFF
jgi:hypothetical protein